MDQLEGFAVNGTGPTALGGVASILLANGMKVSSLRTQGTLRKEEWLLFDKSVTEIARANLNAVGDLVSRGLTKPLSNALGTTVIQWEKIGDMTDAEVTMSGLSDPQRGRLEYGMDSLPIPLIHKDFQINIRTLAASRRDGEGLDTTTAEVASRKVSEMTEKMLFKGATITAGPAGYSGTVYGYTNFPARNTGSLTANWANVGTTGDQIIGDILSMMSQMHADFQYGPYGLYIPLDYYVKLLGDFKTNSDKSIWSRLMEIPNLAFIKTSQFLLGGASGEVVMVNLQKTTVDMIVGMEPTTIQWETHGGMMFNFKVLSIMVPRLKADANGNSGIVHRSL